MPDPHLIQIIRPGDVRANEVPRNRPARMPLERCDVCGTAIPPDHGHLANLVTRTLLCACPACYLLFDHQGAGGARFRAVPQRFVPIADFEGACQAFEALDVPIGLAFFLQNSATGHVTAIYPSAAGAIESDLRLEAWDDLVREVPPLATLAPDVEALLVRRAARSLEALIVPIDACYELVGRIRQAWQGVQGGDDVGRVVQEFFDRALDRARAGAL